MEKIISVKNLRKAYKKETAVQNVCFELAPGNIMGLLGTNGAGKTTTRSEERRVGKECGS